MGSHQSLFNVIFLLLARAKFCDNLFSYINDTLSIKCCSCTRERKLTFSVLHLLCTRTWKDLVTLANTQFCFNGAGFRNALVWRDRLPSMYLQRSGPLLEPDKLVMQIWFDIRKEADNGTIEKSTAHHKGDRNIRQGPNIGIKGRMDLLQSLLLIWQN